MSNKAGHIRGSHPVTKSCVRLNAAVPREPWLRSLCHNADCVAWRMCSRGQPGSRTPVRKHLNEYRWDIEEGSRG